MSVCAYESKRLLWPCILQGCKSHYKGSVCLVRLRQEEQEVWETTLHICQGVELVWVCGERGRGYECWCWIYFALIGMRVEWRTAIDWQIKRKKVSRKSLCVQLLFLHLIEFIVCLYYLHIISSSSLSSCFLVVSFLYVLIPLPDHSIFLLFR